MVAKWTDSFIRPLLFQLCPVPQFPPCLGCQKQARACTRPGAVSKRSPWGSLASVSGRLALGPDVRRGRRSLRVLSQQGCWGEVWVSEAGSLGVRGQGSSHARGGAGTDSDQARVRAAAMACAVSAEDNGLHTTTSVLSFFCFANTI